MENTNNKSKKGLIITLVVFMLAFATCAALLFTGVVKSPLVEEKKCTETKCDTKTTDDTKKTDTKTDTKTDDKVTETRYYQFSKDSSEIDAEGNPLKRYAELALYTDGTVKINYLRTNDTDDKAGVYTEDDKYIIVALNNTNSLCVEGSEVPKTADVCKETIVFIKDGETLKEYEGVLYHFNKEESVRFLEFNKVEKTALQTSLKD